MKIVVADDNLFYRSMLEATLADWGYEVVTVADGAEAWELLKDRGGPPIALLDWMMPGVDGLELCRRVRALGRSDPPYLILLTAKGGKEDVVAGLKSGADDYISKPFDRDELRARLQTGRRIVSLQRSLAVRVQELEHALSSAQKLEVMGRLAGGVAHDFNNLLTIILGGCELLVRQPGVDAQLVRMVQEAGDRGAALTRQLLAFSRGQVLRASLVDINAAITAARGLLARLVPEDVALTIDLDDAAGNIHADPTQLEQVLMNLVVNARDAMPCGGSLTIETRRTELKEELAGVPGPVPPGAYVRCRVTDTGCGMPDEVRVRVFEPFYTTKEAGRGTGLGLATVYGVVKQTGAFIRVESAVGRGTTFELFFPCATETAVPAPLPVKPPRRAKHDRRTVLLVEDEDAVRSLVGNSLLGEQYTVLEARDGDEALRVSRRWPHPIHLMVTDVVMPRMNGRQLADRLVPERPEMRVLFMSGHTDEALREYAVYQTRVPFLQKPFTPEALVGKVRDLLM
jgi:signal transduction histidine kinase